MDAGLAVRLPRGAHPAGRRPHRLRHRRLLLRHRPLGPRHDQGVPQRLPPPGPPTEAVRRQVLGDPLPVPRLRLAPRRRLEARPAHWDLPHVRRPFSLPEVKVGTWEGFVFINPDPDAEPLEEFVKELPPTSTAGTSGPLRPGPRHPRSSGPTGRSPRRRSASRSMSTPPTRRSSRTSVTPTARSTSGRTAAALITPAATPSPLLDWAPDDETILRYALDVRLDEELFITAKEGGTARSAMADATRSKWRPIVGELSMSGRRRDVDNLDYTLFPNFHPWGAFNRIVYRFRPNGDDHRSSIMEAPFLAPFEGDRPPPAPVHHLGVDQPAHLALLVVGQRDPRLAGGLQTELDAPMLNVSCSNTLPSTPSSGASVHGWSTPRWCTGAGGGRSPLNGARNSTSMIDERWSSPLAGTGRRCG